MSENKKLSPVGEWKRWMCTQVKFRWGICETPDGVIIVGSPECDKCRYSYNNDYIE